jgi:hypothetical protein
LEAVVSSELHAMRADTSKAALAQDERGARFEMFISPLTILFVKVVMDHSLVLGEGKLRTEIQSRFGSVY